VIHIKRDIRDNQPHAGSKIKELREAKGYTQEALAQATYTDRSMLSQIECGRKPCTDEFINTVKNYFGVAALPFYESERTAFRRKLYRWNSAIAESDWTTVTEMQENLAVIKFIPCERELNLLYNLFECRRLTGTNELKAAKEILDIFESRADELSDVQLYFYNYNQGTYNARSKQYNEALEFYLKAYEIMQFGLEQNLSIYYGIAFCYYKVGKIARSVSFLEKANQIRSSSQNTVSKISIDIFLAANYIRTGHLQRAKIILEECYPDALDHEKKIYLAMVIINQGYMYRKAKEWSIAIEHFARAFEYLNKNGPNYREALYHKIRCLIELERFSSCTELLAEGIELSKGDETYLILFESLRCLISLNSDKSIQYIETIAIPHMLEKNLSYTALDFCKVLKTHFHLKGRGFRKREPKITEIICKIQSEMLEGGVIE